MNKKLESDFLSVAETLLTEQRELSGKDTHRNGIHIDLLSPRHSIVPAVLLSRLQEDSEDDSSALGVELFGAHLPKRHGRETHEGLTKKNGYEQLKIFIERRQAELFNIGWTRIRLIHSLQRKTRQDDEIVTEDVWNVMDRID